MRDARGLGGRHAREAGCASWSTPAYGQVPTRPGRTSSELQAEDLRQFIATGPSPGQHLPTPARSPAALRAYFRYRATCGDAVHALLGVIASPARWTLATLPRRSQPEEVQRLLTSPRALPSPQPRLAMVRLALDWAARRRDRRLELGDIDWRAGTVTLKRHEVSPAGFCRCRRPPASAGRIPAPRAPTTSDPSVFVRRWRRTTNPSASTPSAAIRMPSGEPASRMAAATPCATRWRAGWSTRRLDQGGGRCAAAPVAEHLVDLRQARQQALAEVALPGLGAQHERARFTCRRGSSSTWPSGGASGSISARWARRLAQLRTLRRGHAVTPGH